MSSRRPPLHSGGVSALAIAHITCTTIAQNLNGPLGLGGRVAKMATILSFFLYPLQYIAKMAAIINFVLYPLHYIWLPILSLIDNRIILPIEHKIETLYPSTTYVFDKIDDLVQIAETLPKKFDNAVNKLPTIDWRLVQAISWLNVMIAVLTHWGSRSSKEKEIRIDTSCKNESPSGSNDHKKGEISPLESPIGIGNKEKFPPISKTKSEAEIFGVTQKLATKGSYKLALEKGKKDYKEALEKGTKENKEKAEEFIESSAKGKNDPILDLFESGWLMSSAQKQEEVTEGTIPQSVSNGTEN